MDVNSVFAANLRELCDPAVPVAQIAREIGISRIQFSRFLKAEAFPKPADLARICRHFEVDARIMLEPLDKLRRENIDERRLTAIQKVFGHADFLAEDQPFPDGLYFVWRRSFMYSDKFVQVPLQVVTRHGVKMAKGYEPVQMYPDRVATNSKSVRQFHGIFLRMRGINEFALIFVHQAPFRIVSMMFLTLNAASAHQFYSGYVVVARPAEAGMRRVSNCVFQKVDASVRDLVRLAHRPAWLERSDIPAHILRLIEGDVAP